MSGKQGATNGRQTALAIAGIVLPRLAFIGGLLLVWWLLRR